MAATRQALEGQNPDIASLIQLRFPVQTAALKLIKVPRPATL
jgi:hypothetical protein